MEIKTYLNEYGIIGVVSNYKNSLQPFNTIQDLNIKNLESALKMVGLDNTIIAKKYSDITINELWKIDLATKLNNEIIIVGNLSTSLNNKDINYMKKLFRKLSQEYHKKIVIIDDDINIFFEIVKKILVVKNHKVIYETEDFFDKQLYRHCKMPKIVEFINYINRDKKILQNNVEIYELIKDIYRSV